MNTPPRTNLLKELLPRLAIIAALAGMGAGLPGCSSESAQQQVTSARTKLEKEDNKGAVIQLKSALQQSPQMPEARFLLGKALLAEGKINEAVVELDKARDLKHPDDDVLPLLAQALLALRQVKKVTDLYGNISLADPKADAALKATVAAAYGAQGRLDLSEASVKRALEYDAKNATARILQARLMAGRGEMDPALAVLDSVVADQPKKLDAWQLKGDILAMGKQDATGAAAAYRHALQLQPRFAAAHVSLINLALVRGDMPTFKAAVDDMSKALPGHPDTLLFEAQSALADKNYAAARNLMQKASASGAKQRDGHADSRGGGTGVWFSGSSREVPEQGAAVRASPACSPEATGSDLPARRSARQGTCDTPTTDRASQCQCRCPGHRRDRAPTERPVGSSGGVLRSGCQVRSR